MVRRCDGVDINKSLRQGCIESARSAGNRNGEGVTGCILRRILDIRICVRLVLLRPIPNTQVASYLLVVSSLPPLTPIEFVKYSEYLCYFTVHGVFGYRKITIFFCEIIYLHFNTILISLRKWSLGIRSPFSR